MSQFDWGEAAQNYRKSVTLSWTAACGIVWHATVCCNIINCSSVHQKRGRATAKKATDKLRSNQLATPLANGCHKMLLKPQKQPQQQQAAATTMWQATAATLRQQINFNNHDVFIKRK